MRTLAELKRTIKPGTRLRCIENTYRPELNGTLRTVIRTQTNAFTWKSDGDARESWTNYPSAKLFKFDGDTFQFSLGRDEHYVKLELLDGNQRGSILPELLMLFFVLFTVATCSIHQAGKYAAMIDERVIRAEMGERP